MWPIFTPIIFGVLLLSVVTPEETRRVCGNIKNNLGYTAFLDAKTKEMRFGGDIFLEYGVDDLDLYCVVTDPKKINPSQWLTFKRGNEVLNGTTITNSTAIHLHIDKDDWEIGSPTIACMYNLTIVCDNAVMVGIPPKPTNFNCVSYNNENFTCSWKYPKNSVSTTYNLSYTVLALTSRAQTYSCPHQEYNHHANTVTCVWSLATTPTYRQSSDHFSISFFAYNHFGNYSYFLPNFDHLAHVIPNPPENLVVANRTTSSLFLQWGIPPTIQHRHLQYRVMYTCGFTMPERVADRTFELAGIRNFTGVKSCSFNLTNLPHAHEMCDIRVALRMNLTQDEKMWSQNATILERTAATVPGDGPKVNVGSFKHINDTAVRIYWHQVPQELVNGPDLRYNVSLVRGNGNVIIEKISTMKNSVVIGNLSANQSYTFALHAINAIGPQSTLPALISIPAQSERPYQVRELKKIENTKGFKLQWEPRLQYQIVNYTVFWCREITTSYNEDCNGDWDWAVVPPDQKEYVYEEPLQHLNSTSFRVAIASNSEYSSSGMIFPTCEESGEQIPTINLMRPYDFGDTSVKLSWTVKCTTEGIANYTIEYCIVEQLSKDCRKNTKQHAHVDGSFTDFVVANLTPYATYLFTIYPTMRNGNKGKTSDPERVTTLEGKPTEPMDLEAAKVTNTSIVLQWVKPIISNGFIYYDIFINGDKVASSIKETNYVLENLKSYYLYNITVEACTSKKCSNPSNSLSLRTLMGIPDRVGPPSARSINTTDILVIWNKPTEPRGPVTYQIKVNDGETHIYTNKTAEYHYTCTQKSNSYTIIVRATNYDEERNITFFGDWSDEFVGSCSPGMGWLIPVLVVLVITLIGTAYFSKRLYTRCKKMQDIDVKLPATLMANDVSIWPPKDPSLRDPKPPPSADEELLLQSRPEVLKAPYVGDSSGCSSAQGSVTSESDGTFSAASDSGTEQSELRKRSFRNSSKTSLLGAEGGMGAKNDNYSQVGVGGIGGMGLGMGMAGLNMGIESNPLSEMDDANAKPTLCTYMQPYLDVEPVNRPPEPQNSSYVTVAQARSLPKPKEEPVSKPYVQVADMKALTQKRDPQIDTNRSYVTVGQMPPALKMNKPFDVKLLKED